SCCRPCTRSCRRESARFHRRWIPTIQRADTMSLVLSGTASLTQYQLFELATNTRKHERLDRFRVLVAVMFVYGAATVGAQAPVEVVRVSAKTVERHVRL